MTAREYVALGLCAALLLWVGVFVPRRTPTLLATLRARIADDPGARYGFYLEYLRTAAFGVVFCVVTVAVSGHDGGLGWPSDATDRLAAAVLLAAVVAIVALALAVLVAKAFDPSALDPRRQWDRLAFLIPHSARERRLWPVMCVAVGVLEELVYRSVLVLLVASMLDVSPWWLVVPVALVFGRAHAFQGWLGVAVSAGLGTAFGVLTVALGTVWPAVVLHALWDLRLLWLTEPDQRPAGNA